MAFRADIGIAPATHLAARSRVADAPHSGSMRAFSRQTGISVAQPGVRRRAGRNGVARQRVGVGTGGIFVLRRYAGGICAFRRGA